MTTTNAAEMTLSAKINLYLAARGWVIDQYAIAPEGKCFKDANGRFTRKSKIVFTRGGERRGVSFAAQEDGSAISEQDAHRRLLFCYLKAQGVFTCQRCGGAGGARHWPGWTCFDCDGCGIDRSVDVEREMDRAMAGEDFCADYIAKRSARIAAEKAEQERLIAERAAQAAAQAAQAKIDNAELIAEARKCLDRVNRADEGEINRFICAIENWAPGYYLPSDHQRDAVKAIIAKVASKAEDPSQHVGTVGERQTFTGTVVFSKEYVGTYGPYTITVLRDEQQNVLKYWNAIRLGDRDAEKGDKVSFSAGIKEHGCYQGVNETTLTRVTKARIA